MNANVAKKNKQRVQWKCCRNDKSTKRRQRMHCSLQTCRARASLKAEVEGATSTCLTREVNPIGRGMRGNHDFLSFTLVTKNIASKSLNQDSFLAKSYLYVIFVRAHEKLLVV